MGILTLGFFGGIILYTVLPEGPVRSLAIGSFGILITYLLYRFGL